MTLSVNPFFISQYESPHYFCDRAVETKRLAEHIRNGRNVVLAAPRRLGKTGLIQHLFHQPEIIGTYYTVYCDVLPTESLQMFVFRLGAAVLEQIKEKRILRKLTQVVKSLRFTVSVDPNTGEPGFGLNLGAVDHPSQSLSEIFAYLNQLDRPVILAIDEFQQVAKYKDKTVEAELRSLIQFAPNVHLIYSGSEQHLLVNLFSNADRPFYMSAVYEGLGVIEKAVYRQFAQRMFSEGERTLPDDVFDRIYDRVEGVTYFVQYLMNFLYARTDKGSVAAGDTEIVLKDAVASNALAFSGMAEHLSANQLAVLLAVAAEKNAAAPTSADFVQRYSLRSASVVQSALRSLVEQSLVERTKKGYRVSDRLFEVWLEKNYSSSCRPEY